MNRVEPAHVSGCFKIFNASGTHRESSGRMSKSGISRGNAVAIPAHSGTILVSLPRYTLESLQSQNYIGLVVVFKDST